MAHRMTRPLILASVMLATSPLHGTVVAQTTSSEAYELKKAHLTTTVGDEATLFTVSVPGEAPVEQGAFILRAIYWDAATRRFDVSLIATCEARVGYNSVPPMKGTMARVVSGTSRALVGEATVGLGKGQLKITSSSTLIRGRQPYFVELYAAIVEADTGKVRFNPFSRRTLYSGEPMGAVVLPPFLGMSNHEPDGDDGDR